MSRFLILILILATILITIVPITTFAQDLNFTSTNRDILGLGNRSLVSSSPQTNFLNSITNQGRGLQVNGLPNFNIQDMVVADFNADSILDVASISSDITSKGQGLITLLFGSGDGSFSFPKTFPTTKTPFAIAASDIDLDGVTDLAIAENGLIEIFSGFLLNTDKVTNRDRLGDPNFGGNGLLTFGGKAVSIAFARLDPDATPDLVILFTQSFSGQVEIFLTADNNGSFTLTSNFTFSTIGSIQDSQKALDIGVSNLADPQTASIDSDLDIFIATSSGVEIFENSLPNFVSQPLLATNKPISQIILQDVTRDNKADILALSPQTNTLLEFPTNNNSYADILEFPIVASAVSFTLFNFNNDGIFDLAIISQPNNSSPIDPINPSNSNIFVLTGTRFGTFQNPLPLVLDSNLVIENPNVMIGARIDRLTANDDLMVISKATPNKTGGIVLLSSRIGYKIPPQQVITNMKSIDFDSIGGVNDLLIIEQNQGLIILLLNNLSQVRTIAVGDLFTNSKQLITSATTFRDATNGTNNLAISMLLNIDSPNPTGQIITGLLNINQNPLPSFNQFVASSGITNLMNGDFNNDLFDDLAYIDCFSNSVATVINDGKNFFLNTTIRETGGFVPVSATLLDANDDDRLDMAVVNQGSAINGNQSLVSILLGNGEGRFQPTGSLLQVPNFALSIAGGAMALSTNNQRQVIDFNQDGFADLAVVSTGSSVTGITDSALVTLLINRSDAPGNFIVQPPIPLKDPTTNISLQLLAKLGGAGMVSGRFGDGSVSLLSDGNATTNINASNGVAIGGANNLIAVGDFNADSSQDIVVSGTTLVNNQNLRSSIYLVGNSTANTVRVVRPLRVAPYLNSDPNIIDLDTFVASATGNFTGTTLPTDVAYISVNGKIWLDTNTSQILNRAPIITIRRQDLNAPFGSGRKAIVTVGQQLTIPVTGFDADNDPLTFSLVPSPNGEAPPPFITIRNTGSTTAQITVDTRSINIAGTSLNRLIAVEATDRNSSGPGGRQPLTSRAYFTLIIRPNSSPTIAPIAPQNLFAGQTVTLNLNISNIEGKNVSITSSCDKGEFIEVVESNLSLVLRPKASDIGTSNCTVTVTDEFGLFSNAVFSVIVKAPSPTINPIPDQIIKPGEPRVINIEAQDPTNTSGLKLQLLSAPSFVTLTDNGNGKATLVIAPSSNETQGGRVNITVTNEFGISASAGFNIQLAKTVNITSVSYSKPNLFIAGSGFLGNKIIIQVNGKDASSNLVRQFDTSLTLTGTKKKLNLTNGPNQVNIIIDGIISNSFIFSL